MAGQELQPRAYVATPVGLNFFSASYSRNVGGLLFDPSLPVEDARISANIPTLTFGQTLGVLGRTAQVAASFAYVQADLSGTISGAPQYRYLSGTADAAFRYAMNLYGAPAMRVEDFGAYQPETIIGASLTVTTPTGQYDPFRIINIGTNRWGIKPELGVSRTMGKWAVEGDAGVWLYTTNTEFAGGLVRTQAPLGSIQGHLVRLLPHRSWIAADSTYFMGGRTRVNNVDNSDYRGNIRLGATLNLGLSPRQSIKISYFGGAVARGGLDIRSLGVSYNIIWRKGRRR